MSIRQKDWPTYREVVIEPNYKATSQNPGKCHSVAEGKNTEATLEDILAYENYAVIHKISEGLGCSSSRAKEVFNDVKRFLWMSASSSVNCIPSPVIDEGWHAFVLFTQDYADFCQKYFGQFLHHLPHKPQDQVINADGLVETIDRMHEIFEGKPSSNWDFISIPTWKKSA